MLMGVTVQRRSFSRCQGNAPRRRTVDDATNLDADLSDDEAEEEDDQLNLSHSFSNSRCVQSRHLTTCYQNRPQSRSVRTEGN